VPLPHLSIWHELLRPDHAPLVAAASSIDPHDAASIDRLRKGRSPEMVRAALMLTDARRNAAAKWPSETAGRLIADPQGVEMATSALAAAHKARRFVEVLGEGALVLDLCCGIGGDAMGLTAAGLKVLAIDKDDARSWMCAQNAGAGCTRRACDVLDASLPDGPFHLDPSRRTESDTGEVRRLFQIDDHWPGPSIWRTLIERHRDGAIKLGPGLDIEAVRRVLPPGVEHEIEIISERGRLTQAVLWVGRLARHARGARTATLLHNHNPPTSLRAEAGGCGEPPGGPLRRYLIEADASIERAGLLLAAAHQTTMTTLAPGLGLLTGEAPAPGPLFSNFAVVATMPWIEKNARAWLKDHDSGIVEIKTRGRAIDPDHLQTSLRGPGSTRYTLFILRIGRSLDAIITLRVNQTA